MGGMSAFIPIKSDPIANEKALAGVRADKEREATNGHDGTWVAHPGLVPIAMEVFRPHHAQPNQISKQLPDFHVTAAELLAIPTGTITEAGLKQNVAVGIGYLEAWLRGIGCVPLFNMMEDAATAEISRSQLWQWVHHHAVLEDGRPVTRRTLRRVHRRRVSPREGSLSTSTLRSLRARRLPHPRANQSPPLSGLPHPARLRPCA